MAKPRSKLKQSLKQLAEIQVNDWDFMALMNKDIKDVEITNSLRKLGNLQVMEWDFRTVLPAVSNLANREVDVAGMFRRAANYKVIEWDFRKPFQGVSKPILSHGEMQALTGRLKDFLQYTAASLVADPKHAQIRTQQIAPQVLRLKLVLTKRDAAMLIGTGGHTAAALRHILKAVAGKQGIHVLLQILSHEEDAAAQQMAREPSAHI